MKHPRIIIIAAALVFSIAAQAQNKWQFDLEYNAAIPVGGFKSDFINKTSFRGATGEVRYAISPKFALGVQSGYQYYYQKYPRQLYKLSTGEDISAVMTNVIDNTPILLKGTYYPMASGTGRLQPFVSAGVGVNMITYSQYLGEFGSSDPSTAFAALAAAGVQYGLGKARTTAIKLGGTFNYVNYKRNDLAHLNNVGVSLGVLFPLK